ncbi:putative cyclic nucleotide-gated ion channel 20, chloroplastic [Dorcoceras hygrometricum]|uniref:Putative cyclic nucleotide-gated ion channel 20, chloroplastic n=1 Tax=Dorcoceras hygrometricum TaxID=472368 RepID=A0A2Z7CEL1_9LAMI|nr:putative cyclic nucleotide-gated ion channel 20, chloroplastic [Dorcoceras hygrometricum]
MKRQRLANRSHAQHSHQNSKQIFALKHETTSQITRSLKCTLSRSCMRFAYVTRRPAYVTRSTAQLSNERYTLLTTDLLTSPSSAARSLSTTQSDHHPATLASPIRAA